MRDGNSRPLAFDMGGTTAKLSLIEDGQPSIASASKRPAATLREGSGLPIRITTVDLIEIGAGGGSIAHEDQLGLLKVGPQSAGSEPGPACYGLGGTEPTVTDANLVLGYLNPDYFAGGTLSIDSAKARASLGGISASLQREVIDVAWGIHDIVAENMAGAAHGFTWPTRTRSARLRVAVHRRRWSRRMPTRRAKDGVKTIICPPAAGVASAYGLLVASARADRSRTMSFRPSADSLEALEQAFTALESDARAALERLEQTFGPLALTRQADGRFVGQGFNLSVKLPQGPYLGKQADSDQQVRAALDHGIRDRLSGEVWPHASGRAGGTGEPARGRRSITTQAVHPGAAWRGLACPSPRACVRFTSRKAAGMSRPRSMSVPLCRRVFRPRARW